MRRVLAFDLWTPGIRKSLDLKNVPQSIVWFHNWVATWTKDRDRTDFSIGSAQYQTEGMFCSVAHTAFHS